MGKITTPSNGTQAMIRPIHVRMARAGLELTLTELAELAGVNKNTISRYEAGKDIVASSLQRIEQVLQEAGAVFFEADNAYGTGVGINPRKRHGRGEGVQIATRPSARAKRKR